MALLARGKAMDTAFKLALVALNVAVAYANALAYDSTREIRDKLATLAWLASAAYWAFRALVG